jgi:hypothetical protein
VLVPGQLGVRRDGDPEHRQFRLAFGIGGIGRAVPGLGGGEQGFARDARRCLGIGFGGQDGGCERQAGEQDEHRVFHEESSGNATSSIFCDCDGKRYKMNSLNCCLDTRRRLAKFHSETHQGARI